MSELAGKTIAVPETRELDVLARLFEKRGATAIRCPLVAIFDAPDPAPIEAWLRRFIDGGCDDLILLTGEGLRRLRGFAGRVGNEFVTATPGSRVESNHSLASRGSCFLSHVPGMRPRRSPLSVLFRIGKKYLI